MATREQLEALVAHATETVREGGVGDCRMLTVVLFFLIRENGHVYEQHVSMVSITVVEPHEYMIIALVVLWKLCYYSTCAVAAR